MIPDWLKPTDVPRLSEGAVHVWVLETAAGHPLTLAHSLSEAELKKAGSFRFAKHRDEFIVTRGALRFLLGKYTRCEPRQIQLRTAERGKPYIPDGAPDNIQFNISHSGEYAVLAFAVGEQLGIDIEQHRAGVIDDGLLKQCLTDAEMQSYSMAAGLELSFFFDTWARKEAYLKLMGDGLSIQPNQFSLSSPQTEGETISGERIHFSPLPVIEGYSGALATTHRSSRIEFYKLGSNLLR